MALTQAKKEFWIGFIAGLVVTGILGAALLVVFFL